MKRILIVLIAALLASVAVLGESGGVQVIVNPANPLTSVEKADVSKIFLKKLSRWPNGQPTQPVDLPESSGTRAQFCSQIVGKSVAAVSAYWQQQIFAGKELPPMTKASEAEVIAFVKANPNAIGYVAAPSVTHEVKVLALK
jgi:ABC-type phosphate transport system substrate-binding protein